MAHQQRLKDTTKNLANYTKQLAEETQQELNKLNRLIGQQNEVLGAMVRLLGTDAVDSAIMEMREEAAAQLAEKQKEGVKYLVERKVMSPAETITAPYGYVVGIDKLKDGAEKRVQFEISAVNPQFLPLYVGKKVGETVEGNGAVLTITEIYTIDPVRFQEVMKDAEPKPADDAATSTDAPVNSSESAPTADENVTAAPTPPVDNDQVAPE
jgi:hypothetical protein